MIVFTPIEITDAILTSSNVPENDNAEWNAQTQYMDGQTVMVSTVEPNIHRNYEALINNQNQAPWTNPNNGANPPLPFWLDLGATNRWRMFDDGNSTQTTNTGTVDVTLTPNQPFNAIALLNTSAATVQIIMNDSTDGEVYNETFNLTSDSGINDWHAYYFTPIERNRRLVALDLPSYPQATIRVIVSDDSASPAVGVLAIGNQVRLGDTDYGAETSIRDYSTKGTDAFGNFSIVERPFSYRGNFPVTIDTNRAEFVENYLTTIRNTPAIWVGDSEHGSTIIYGFYRDHRVTLTGFTLSRLNLTIEGLT